MANHARGQKDITIDGRTYTLWFTINSLVELEDLLKAPITKLGDDFTKGDVGFKEMRALFWAGLIEKHPEITLKDAGHLMHAAGLEKVLETAAEAFALAFPEGNAQKN